MRYRVNKIKSDKVLKQSLKKVEKFNRNPNSPLNLDDIEKGMTQLRNALKLSRYQAWANCI